jgi:riboflavin kinase/FMN adenylyltransferase
MFYFQDPSQIPAKLQGGVFAIGNFDGVHLGHQALMSTVRSLGQERQAPIGLLTFEPHPRAVFVPDSDSFRLTPSLIKRRHMEVFGVDLMVELKFDSSLFEMSPDRFVKTKLVSALAPSHLVVGWDFCFGRGREGNAATLTAMGRDHGFGVTVVDPVCDPEATVYSSNLIRQFLTDGEPSRAAALLGHLWEIAGEVQRGDQRGRTIGFPTANIGLADYLVPKLGVYAVRAGRDNGAQTEWRDGVANIGTRPTVGGDMPLLELHLLDFDGDIYGEPWRVALVEFIRAERKFDGLDALKSQISADATEARQLLAARRIRAGDMIGDAPGEKLSDNAH